MELLAVVVVIYVLVAPAFALAHAFGVRKALDAALARIGALEARLRRERESRAADDSVRADAPSPESPTPRVVASSEALKADAPAVASTAAAPPPPPPRPPQPSPAVAPTFTNVPPPLPPHARDARDVDAAQPGEKSPAPPRRERAPKDVSHGSLERALGVSVYVWLGGAALALAAAFFVKFAVDRGLLGPGVRCALGAAFGFGLIGFAERYRRLGSNLGQALAGAGVVALYASLFASVELYGFVPPIPGTVLSAVVTAGAVLLSFRHGPAVAALGLLGGYAAPALIAPQALSVEVRLAYLFALHAGLTYVAVRARRPFALLSLAAAALWALRETAIAGTTVPTDALALYALAVASATVFAGLRFARGVEVGRRAEDPPEAFFGAAAGAILVGAALERAGYPPHLWWSSAVLGAGALFVARRFPGARFLPWTAAAAGAVSALLCGSQRAAPGALPWIACGGAALYGVGAGLLGRGARDATSFAWLSASATAAFLGVGRAFAPAGPLALPWWAVALVFGAVHAGFAALRLARRADPVERASAVPHVVAAAASLGAAAALGLDDEPVAVAFALLAPTLIAVARRLDLAELRDCAAVAAAIGFFRVLLWDNPAARLLRGADPHWASLWTTVGVAIVAFAAAAYLLRKDEARHPKRRYVLAACRLLILFVGLALRYGRDDRTLLRFDAQEAGLLCSAWLVLALGFVEAARRFPLVVPKLAGVGTAAMALGALLLAHDAGASPWSAAADVGPTPVLNALATLYLLPAVLLAALALRWRKAGVADLPGLAAGCAFLLAWGWICVAVRHAFRGVPLRWTSPDGAELYAYSVAWIAYAVLLLFVGVRTKSKVIRVASAVVMLAAVSKVFLVDAADLRDLWRVASFLGLGATLLALGRVYQRFVFPPAR